MSAPNVNNIYRSPGRLVKNPTNLSAVYPHGGTELGVVRDMAFKANIKTANMVAEEFGRPVEVLFMGEEAAFAGVLRTWDNDLMAALFYGTQTDTHGDVGLVGNAKTYRPGYPLTRKGIVLLFSPTAVDRQKHILIYNAVPVVDEAFEMKNSINEEFGCPFFFQAIPDAIGRTYSIDLRANLSL
jgi:hypothetical protein